MRRLVGVIARRDVRRQLEARGLGHHSSDDVMAIAKQDIDAVTGLLGDKWFFTGVRPSHVDASAYGVLANVLANPWASTLKDEVLWRSNLVDFVERVRSPYFPAGTR